MVTATFSNGYVDTYKGKRPVKAAWAIIAKATGEVLNSGHSLDAAKALKTAESNLAYCGAVLADDHPLRSGKWAGARGGFGLSYREASAARAHNAARLAAIRAAVTIEVVAL